MLQKLKKICLREGTRALDFDEAWAQIEKGQNVCVAISYQFQKDGPIYSDWIENIKKIGVHEDKIVVVDSDGLQYNLDGWDRDIRQIKVQYFINIDTNDEYHTLTEAICAVGIGYRVAAVFNNNIQTGQIVWIEGREKFGTLSGSVYEMV